MIQLNHIHMKFKKKTVLSEIDFSFPETGFFVIYGKSGIGKTTLLNIITGLQKPTDGQVLYDDTDIYKLSFSERRVFLKEKIGYVFQKYNLVDELTVFDNLRLGNQCSSEEIAQTLKYLDIEDLKDEKAKVLSGGEQQRVAIARALLKNPDILIADEPTGNLDEENAIRVIDYLKEISKNTLVIMVSHNMNLLQDSEISFLKLSKEKIEVTKMSESVPKQVSIHDRQSKANDKIGKGLYGKLLFSALYGKKLTLLLQMFLFLISSVLITLSLTILTYQQSDMSYRLLSKYNKDKGIIEVVKEVSFNHQFKEISSGEKIIHDFEGYSIGKKQKYKDFDYIRLENFDSIPLLGRAPLHDDEVVVSMGLSSLMDKTIEIEGKEYQIVGATSLFEEDPNDSIVFGSDMISKEKSISMNATPRSMDDFCYYVSPDEVDYKEEIKDDEIVISRAFAEYYHLSEGETYQTMDSSRYDTAFFDDEINPAELIGTSFKVKEILDGNQDHFVVLNQQKYDLLKQKYDEYFNFDSLVLIHPVTRDLINTIFDSHYVLRDETCLKYSFALSINQTFSFFGIIFLIASVILFVVVSVLFFRTILLGFRKQFLLLDFLGIRSRYTLSHLSIVGGGLMIVDFLLNTLVTFLMITILNQRVFSNPSFTDFKNFDFLLLRMDLISFLLLISLVVVAVLIGLSFHHFKKAKLRHGL